MPEQMMQKCKGCHERQEALDCANALLKASLRLNECILRALERATTPVIVPDEKEKP